MYWLKKLLQTEFAMMKKLKSIHYSDINKRIVGQTDDQILSSDKNEVAFTISNPMI